VNWRPASWIRLLVVVGAGFVAVLLLFSIPILGLVMGPRFVLEKVRSELKEDPAALAVLDRERDVLRYIERRIVIDKLSRREEISRLVVGYTRKYSSKFPSPATIQDSYLYSWKGQTVHLFTLVYDSSGKFIRTHREE
jgi:hypothetical protein